MIKPKKPIGGIDESPKPDCSAANGTARAGSEDIGNRRILTRHTDRRAPGNEFPFAAGDDEPCPRFDVGMGVIANRFRVQMIPLEVDDVFRRNAVEFGDSVQSIAFLPFIICAVHRKNVEFLSGFETVRVIEEGIVICPQNRLRL
jgi:hypothetical protein